VQHRSLQRAGTAHHDGEPYRLSDNISTRYHQLQYEAIPAEYNMVMACGINENVCDGGYTRKEERFSI